MPVLLIRVMSLSILAGVVSFARAEPMRFVSPVAKITLVELYTSEGCSSCPPADAWLSNFRSHPRLWKGVIPLAFHVDYWNYLGWPDEFSDKAFSQRQRRHKAVGNVNGVYTPGFVINGREWRGFFGLRARHDPPLATGKMPGRLTLTRDGERVRLDFEPVDAANGPWTANLVWLGFDLENRISRGENAGRTLAHDFVVLEHRTGENPGSRWEFRAPAPEKAGAIVAWISRPGNPAPVQAVGGWLQE